MLSSSGKRVRQSNSQVSTFVLALLPFNMFSILAFIPSSGSFEDGHSIRSHIFSLNAVMCSFNPALVSKSILHRGHEKGGKLV